MKLILFLIIVFFSTQSFSFLIPNPNVELDSQLHQDPLKKRESFIKFSNDFYIAYVSEFRKINNVNIDPFMPGLQNEINGYFKRLTENEINTMTSQQVANFMREQLADQLYIPYSKENSQALINDASSVLQKTANRLDLLERKLLDQLNSNKKVKLSGSSESISLDLVYLAAIVTLGAIIFLLTFQKKSKKAK